MPVKKDKTGLILNRSKLSNIYFYHYNMWLELSDGRKLSVPLENFPVLKNAQRRQLYNYIIFNGGQCIFWDELNLNLNLEDLLLGIYS